MTTRKGNQGLGSNMPFKKPKLQKEERIPPENSLNAWGDDSDDDDLILLASQVVEQTAGATAAPATLPPSTFQRFLSEFEKDQRTSTQQQPVYEISSQDSTPEPVLTTLSVNLAMRAKVSTTRVMTQNKASQDFLRKRIETLEKDKSKASEECHTVLEKLQIKDYELSTLKYELQQMQKINSDLRMKLVKNGQIEKEVERNKNLDRLLAKAEADLELKNLELLKLKSDRRMSTQVVVEAPPKLEPPKPPPRDFVIDALGRFQVLQSDSWQARLAHRIFEQDSEVVGKGAAVFGEHIKHLQTDLALLILGQEVEVNRFVGRILETMELALNGAWGIDSNVQLHTSKHRSRRNFLPDPMDRDGASIFDKIPLFENEELVVFRRILAILATALRLSPSLRKAFFDTQLHKTLMRILEGLSKTTLEYQNRTLGIVQCAAIILLNLVRSGYRDETIIARFMKSLTFSRHDSFTIYLLMKILATMDDQMPRSFLCYGSEPKHFAIYPTHKVAQLTTSSCLLQVLATSMESAFPVSAPKGYWTIQRFRRLLATTRTLIRFYRRHVIEVPKDWLTIDKPCQCFVAITTSFVILFHLCLHLFQTIPSLQTELRQIHVVSQLGLLLIHDVFVANLPIKLLHGMGRSIKNRLIVVFNWLSKFNELFYFRLAQVKALEAFEVNLFSNSLKPSKLSMNPNSEQRKVAACVWESLSV